MASDSEPKFTVIIAIDGSAQAEHAFNCKFFELTDISFLVRINMLSNLNVFCNSLR